jgi:hypothetical protein
MLAIKLYTGKGGASHVTEGTVMLDRRTDVTRDFDVTKE